MKMFLKYKNFIICLAVVVSAISLQSCSDDEKYDVVGSTQNIVFINTQQFSPVGINNGTLFKIQKTAISNLWVDTDVIQGKFTVQCTKAAESDIVVKFEIDNSLVLDNYSGLPSGITLQMDKSQLTIPKGAMIASDSITISIDASKVDLFDLGTYIASVKIVSVNNAESSSSYNTASLVIKTAYDNCTSNTTTVPSGTAADRTGWTAVAADTDQGTKLFDGNNNTYFRHTGSYPVTIEVDLGSVYSNITGFALRQYNTNYVFSQVKLYTKEDTADDYFQQGTISLTRATTQYINFYGAVDARYIKMEVVSPYSTSYGLAFCEFNMYQQ